MGDYLVIEFDDWYVNLVVIFVSFVEFVWVMIGGMVERGWG